MTACFRCHGLEKGAAAPGACAACHTADFELKPPATTRRTSIPKATPRWRRSYARPTKAAADGEAEAKATRPRVRGDELPRAREGLRVRGRRGRAGHQGRGSRGHRSSAQHGASDDESSARSCRRSSRSSTAAPATREQFCINCHGMEMPHPAEFKEPKDAKDPDGPPGDLQGQARRSA